MGKPRVQVRVDESTKRDLIEYADEQELTEADATRRVLSKGLEAERGELAVADGGLEQLAEKQERQQQSQQYQAAGWAFGIVYLALLTTGVMPDLVAAVFGAAIVAVLSYSIFVARRGDDDEEEEEIAGWEVDDYR